MIGLLMRKIFLRNMISPLTEIELNEKGFLIKEPFGAKLKQHNWEEIKSVRFSENHNDIFILKLEKKSL